MLWKRKHDAAVAGLLICVLAVVAIGPHFAFGYPHGHSWEFNVPWATAFTGQLLSGDLYPRWLTDYPAGLGAPVFYFYAPAPFYLSALGVVLCWDCGVEALLSFGHWAMYALSGIAFYFWIRGLTGRIPAFLMAGSYMFLPYHMLDLDLRAALGESMAYIWIPLILLSIRFMHASYSAAVLTAFAYAGLILSHIPSALLFTPIMVLFTFITARGTGFVASAGRLVFAGLLGVGLSAIYFIPALMLRDYLPPDAWGIASGPHFFPERWLFFGDRDGPKLGSLIFLALIASSFCAVAGIAAVTLLGHKFGKNQADYSSVGDRALTAALVSLAFCWLMMTPPSEWLWINLKFLRQVQFPWRFGPAVDFCSATILAIAIDRAIGMDRTVFHTRFGLLTKGLCAVVILANVASFFLATRLSTGFFPTKHPETSLTAEIARQPNIPIDSVNTAKYPIEYRSKWIVQSAVYTAGFDGRQYSNANTAYLKYREGYRRWVSHVAALPLIRIVPRPERNDGASMVRVGSDSFRIKATLSGPATLHVRRAYFPNVRARDLVTGREVPVHPNADDGLLAFDLSAGEHKLLVTTGFLRWEIVGFVVTTLALLGASCVIGRERWARSRLRS